MLSFEYWPKLSYISLSIFSIYLSAFHDQEKFNTYRVLPKILPILLAIWQVRQSIQNAGITLAKTRSATEVLIALAFSALGDGLLVYGENDQAFIAGIIAFGIAHVLYIKSVGWKYISIGTLLATLSIYLLIQTYVVSAIENG